MGDWFRKTSWTTADSADFEMRLMRARRASRSQYLRIQAVHLAEAGHHAEALLLLERLLVEYPDPIQLAQAHCQRAESLNSLGRRDEAEVAYRAALDVERELPNVLSRAAFRFPLFVALHSRAASFADALELLDVTSERVTFPVDRFEVAAARAFIAESQGDLRVAREQADAALDAASQVHSGLARHRSVGLVQPNEGLLTRLRDLANPKTPRSTG